MGASFKRNRNWPDEVKRSPEMRAVIRSRAKKVAEEAERIGRQVAPSYRTTVDEEDHVTRVSANTGGINAAGWIEVGTGAPSPTPAYAPLRKGAEAAGLKTASGNR